MALTKVDLRDSETLVFGTGDDLTIQHDGSNSLIDSITGSLKLRSNNGNMAVFTPDAAVELYHNEVKKFETHANGVTVTGRISVSGNSGVGLIHGDSVKAVFGDGDDLEIYHDGTRNYIDSKGTQLRIETDELRLRSDGGETYAEVDANGQFKMYYDNSEKLLTQSLGARVNGRLYTTDYIDCKGDIFLSDSKKAVFGGGSDLQIYHDGSNSYISNTHASSFYIQSNGALLLEHTNGENYFKGNANAATELYYDASTKLSTTSSGITVTGNVLPSGGNLTLMDSSAGGNGRATFGGGEDLQIYHSGTHSFINHEGDGHLIISGSTTNNVDIMKAGHSEYMARFIPDGSVYLYYDAVRVLSTTATGVAITGPEGGSGTLEISSDEADDNADIWRFSASASASELYTQNYASGGWETSTKSTGNGNVELYFDNSKKLETTSEGIRLGDSVKAEFGNGDDLQLFHNGTENVIYSNAGNLDLVAQNGTKAIRVHTDATVDIGFATDNVQLRLGAGSDLKLYHDGSDSRIKNSTGSLWLQSDTGIRFTDTDVNESMAAFYDNGAVELYYDGSKKLNTNADGITISNGSLYFGDYSSGDGSIRLGASQDFKIYHDGSDSFIEDAGTGSLIIAGSEVKIVNHTASENLAKFIPDGAVELYYDNSKKLETTSAGVTITGSQSKIVGDLRFDNSTDADKDIYWDESEDRLNWFDNVKATFGNSDDIQIFHDGTVNRFLLDGETYFNNKANSECFIITKTNGAVELYYDNSKKLETTSEGIKISGSDGTGTEIVGDVFFNNGSHASADIKWDQSEKRFRFDDNVYAAFGSGSDFRVQFDGTNSYIDSINGSLYIETGASTYITKRSGGSENMAAFNSDGGAFLYYDNSVKLETNSGGIEVSGNVHLADDREIRLGGSVGDGGDLKIYHDGSNSRIKTANIGALILNADHFNVKRTDNSENILITAVNGACELYYDNTKRFETKSDGVTVHGNFYAWEIYNNTTSGGANVRVQSSGLLQRDTSSRRYKNSIVDAVHGLTDLKKLRSVTFKGNSEGDTIFGGLIAEEVHDAGLTEFVDYNSKNQPDALRYGNMVALCIKAIQELSTQVETLQSKVALLEAK